MDDIILRGRKTIEQEANALASFAHTIGEEFRQTCELVLNCRRTTVLTGMGKSGIVARKWASTFASTGTNSYFLNPAEASHGDLGILHPGDVLIALSYSGETQELISVLKYARDMQIPLVAVTGNPTSTLARQANIVLVIQFDEEACPLRLAPTTSTTLMMALGDAMATTLMQLRAFTEKDFARLHPGGTLGRRLWLRVADLMHRDGAIPIVRPSDKFETVLVTMTGKMLGLAVVMDGEKVRGIVTDGDLRRHLQKSGFSKETSAETMMTAKPKWIGSQALAIEARELMEANSIQHLLVKDEDEKFVGVIHFHDLLRAKVL